MKTIWKQLTFGGKTHCIMLKEIGGKKVKCTYEVGNAYERFTVEVFDGEKFNQVANIWDLGAIPDSSTYIYEKDKIQHRHSNLQRNADTYIKTLLS